ncbi:MAG: thioredoxin [Ruminococcaceae bacterium]|nr:thioredoxin [Oscillospiraceae bacterium]
MSVLHLNKEKFEEIKHSDKPVLLDFYADWCGPCKLLAPTIDKLAEEHPEYVIAKINVDHEPELAGEFGIFSIPTLVVIKNGKVTSKSVGAKSKNAIIGLLES